VLPARALKVILSMLPVGSLIVSVGSLAVAIAAFYFANDALSAKRPWVSVVDDDALKIREPLSLAQNTARIVIELQKVKNGGDSAAAGTSLFVKGLVIGPPPKDAKTISIEMNERCDPGNKIYKPQSGELILPNDKISLGEYLFSAPATAIGPAWIWGCIGYQDAKKHLFATSFVYSIEEGQLRRVRGLSVGGY
jgi:hypothetical protein